MKRLLAILALFIPNLAAASTPHNAITSKLNGIFSFELPSNPTTGYGWMIKTLPKNVVLVGMEYTPPQNCTGALGCEGVEKFHFKAIKIGTGAVELKYGRPFEALPKESQYQYIIVTK